MSWIGNWMNYWAQGSVTQSSVTQSSIVVCPMSWYWGQYSITSLLTWKGCTLRSFADDNNLRGVPDTPDACTAIWIGLRGWKNEKRNLNSHGIKEQLRLEGLEVISAPPSPAMQGHLDHVQMVHIPHCVIL